jgi:predicted RNA-binding protein with PIN domain
MSLQFIIDGYNIINHPQFIPENRRAIKDPRISLLELIKYKRLCGSPKNRVSVVFDGYPKIQDSAIGDANIKVVYSGGDSADTKIKTMLENSRNIKNTVVVSDDKEIKFFAKSLGAKIKATEEFIKPKTKSLGVDNRKKQPRDEFFDYELTYTQRSKINEELRKIWLE